MKGINYAELFFGIITCLDRELYGRSLRGDSTVDPSNLLKNLKYLVEISGCTYSSNYTTYVCDQQADDSLYFILVSKRISLLRFD